MLNSLVRRLVASAAALLVAAVAQAQNGTLAGRVTAAENGRGLSGARVTVLSGVRTVSAVVSGPEGNYSAPNIPAGTYVVQVTQVGRQLRRLTDVIITAGRTTRLDAELSEIATVLTTTTVTAGRIQEKALEAPAQISVVTTEQIATRPSVTVADHVRGQPGIDVSAGGIAQSMIVARGFNNAFTGSLLTLQDYRFAGVPSLRVNVPFLFTGANEDIERIELLLGPASALYGPNSSAGVMHVITKSPFSSQGTTLTVDGGERNIFRGALRHAGTVGQKFGYKFSGEYFTGNDWNYRDPGEPDSITRRLTDGGPRTRVANTRDFLTQRYAGEARVDWRPREGMEFITTYGRTQVNNAIELTGANGASQIRNWNFQSIQQRFRWNRLFAQVFANLSDAGNADSLSGSGTYLLRTGTPIVDQSRVYAGQLQHGFRFGRADVIYGGDYIKTNPRTGGTINGANEDRDDVTEYGGYVQAKVPLSSEWDFLGAVRLDRSSVIDGNFFSPRAALIWKPEPTRTVRVVYNRAFSTPANFSFFLDLPQGGNAFNGLVNSVRGGLGPAGALVPGAPFNYDVIANGNPPKTGFQYDRSCGAASGFGSFCMRSSLPGLTGAVPASAATAFPRVAQAMTPALAAVITAQLTPTLGQAGAAAAANAIMTRLSTATPTNADIATRATLDVSATLLRGAPGATPESIRDLRPLGAAFNDTYELGYKGLGMGGKLSFDVSTWYQRRGDVAVTAALATPTVLFGNPVQLGGYIGQQVGVALGTSGLPLTPAQIQLIAGQLAPNLAQVFAPLPLGTVTFDSDIVTNGNLRATYQRLDKTVDVWGADIGVSYAFNSDWSADWTASVVNNIIFQDVFVGPQNFMTNAPGAKTTLTGRYASQSNGWGGELRWRYTNAFPVNSGVFVSGVPLQTAGTVVGRPQGYTYQPVPVNNLVDVGISKRFGVNGGRSITWSLNVTNVFDNRVPSFVGTAEIGRLAVTRLSTTF